MNSLVWGFNRYGLMITRIHHQLVSVDGWAVFGFEKNIPKSPNNVFYPIGYIDV